MTGKKKTKSRGTDEPFLRLMGIGGPAVGKREMLKEILLYAVRSPDMEDFNKTLAKVVSALKPAEKAKMSG